MSISDLGHPTCITVSAANDNRPGSKRFRVRILQQGVAREMLLQVFGVLLDATGAAASPANDNFAGSGERTT